MAEICSPIPIATSSRSRLTRTTAQITTIVVAEKMETVRNLRGLGTLGIRPGGGHFLLILFFQMEITQRALDGFWTLVAQKKALDEICSIPRFFRLSFSKNF